MAVTENYVFNLPFAEQINYFRGKVNLPTKDWVDMWQGMHSRAFVVAGATKAELLCDLRSAVDKAISKGTTLQEFRRDFDQIVQKHGWDYKGGRDWRTRVIYDTNLRTAAAAGRHAQLTTPAAREAFPYWRYVHGNSKKPREEHLRFHGLILPNDHPFWQEHEPPNGFNCSCTVQPIMEHELEKYGKTAPDEAPDFGTYDWTNPKTGETVKVPVGVSPGWAYSVGETAWGRVIPSDEFKPNAWNTMTQGRQPPVQGTLTALKTDIKPDYAISDTEDGITNYLKQSFGGETVKIFEFNKNGFRLNLAVDAEYMGKHLSENGKKGRAQFLPYLQDLIKNPQEVWLAFEQHAQSGKVRLRQRFLKFVDMGDKARSVAIVFDAANGKMGALTFIPVRGNNINSMREGYLVYRQL